MSSLSYPIQVGVVITCWNTDTVITLRPRQNGRHFTYNIFKCISLNENVWIVIEISLKFVSKGPINNIPILVQLMDWCRLGDKPLSEPTMVSLLMHIYVTAHSNSRRHTKSSIFFLFHMIGHIKLEQYGYSTACLLVCDAYTENTVGLMPTLYWFCTAVTYIKVGIMATLWWD